MFLAGMAVSSSGPLITLFLTKELGADTSVVGLFYLTSIAGLFINLYTGQLSDRLSSRIPLIKGSAIWLSIGWAFISLSQNSITVFIVGVVFFSLMGTLNAQTFGVVRDVMNVEKEAHEATLTSIIRTAYSFGWMLGPAIGPLIASIAGYRIAFLIAVALFLAILIPLRNIHVPEKKEMAFKKEKKPLKLKTNRPLIFFGVICMLVLSGEAARIAYLPLLAVDHLQISLFQFGLLMSIAPFTELFIMPLSGILADKFGVHKVLFTGFLLGAIGFFLFANSTHLWQVVLGQIMNACFISTIFGLAVTYAHQLSPNNIGLASSVFFSAESAAFVLGSLMGSYGVHSIGLPFMFFIPAVLCVVSSILFIINDFTKARKERKLGLGPNT
ncbi:MFS transporter [Domibacillus tundrae]|uniref:MFS transporter n=1 Tax=Domibacillus tundrae TaxID=1587527 RepID=UPI003396BEE6